MWKKGSALLVAGSVLLTGCAGEASLVRDSIVATIDKPNYDFEGSLKLTGDIAKLPEAFGEPVDKEGQALLAALQAGVTVKGSQLDMETVKFEVEVKDDKLLRDNNLWTGDKKASVETIVDEDKLYVKSPLDSKYLVIDSSSSNPFMANPGGSDAANAAKLKDYQDKMNDLTFSFIKKYVGKYGYTLADAKNHGKQSVTLPNGEKVEATRVTVKIDAKELVKMFFFTANDAVASKEVKDFAIDMMVLTSSMAEDLYPEAGKKTTDAEKRANAEAMITEGMAEAKKWLDETGKVYTPEKVVEEMKKEGFHSLAWNLDFYIDSNKMPVKQTSDLSVTFQAPEMKQPVTVGLAADQYAYNFGKATKFDAPAKDAGVTVEQLVKDEKAINSFSDKGFVRPIAEGMVDQQKWLEEMEAEMEAELEVEAPATTTK